MDGESILCFIVTEVWEELDIGEDRAFSTSSRLLLPFNFTMLKLHRNIEETVCLPQKDNKKLLPNQAFSAVLLPGDDVA